MLRSNFFYGTDTSDVGVLRSAVANVMYTYDDQLLVADYATDGTVNPSNATQTFKVCKTPNYGSGLYTGLMTVPLTINGVSVDTDVPCLMLTALEVNTIAWHVSEPVAALCDKLALLLGYYLYTDGEHYFKDSQPGLTKLPLWFWSSQDRDAEHSVMVGHRLVGCVATTYTQINAYAYPTKTTLANNKSYVTDANNACDCGPFRIAYTDGAQRVLPFQFYLTDMENIQDLSRQFVNAMGNPSETTALTADVNQLKDTVATLTGSSPDSIDGKIDAAITNESAARAAAVAAVATAVSQIPVFGAHLRDVASAASAISDYVPRS